MPIAACSGRGPAVYISQCVIALCDFRRYLRREPSVLSQAERSEKVMRAEIERLVEEIKQSVGLLRRHL
jgi:hypothetical protein